ncbi:hypothetical protein OG252_50545 [Streptomyces sp. NBC_01352]|uniref:hypothetical protein n=1 Tax=Streptomyces sp. NBC_01352 TaxID=2903834 RepID=UPI002E2EC6A9|nr:hypothetical protein [Streptomyces sp. NBC_01352]
MTSNAASAAPSGQSAVGEHEQLQALYRTATDEGGRVTLYMGGDAPGFFDFIPQAFRTQFPGIQVNTITDLSKYHDARIDNQLVTDNLVADVAILQTTHDFDRWKAMSQLLRYRPVGWDHVFDNAKDPDSHWASAYYGVFSPIVGIHRCLPTRATSVPQTCSAPCSPTRSSPPGPTMATRCSSSANRSTPTPTTSSCTRTGMAGVCQAVCVG